MRYRCARARLAHRTAKDDRQTSSSVDGQPEAPLDVKRRARHKTPAHGTKPYSYTTSMRAYVVYKSIVYAPRTPSRDLLMCPCHTHVTMHHKQSHMDVRGGRVRAWPARGGSHRRVAPFRSLSVDPSMDGAMDVARSTSRRDVRW